MSKRLKNTEEKKSLNLTNYNKYDGFGDGDNHIRMGVGKGPEIKMVSSMMLRNGSGNDV